MPPSDAEPIGSAQGNGHPSAWWWLRPRVDGWTDLHCFCASCGTHWQKACADPLGAGARHLLRFGMFHAH